VAPTGQQTQSRTYKYLGEVLAMRDVIVLVGGGGAGGNAAGRETFL
jgi:hypothetical protein